jgi:hypothetical protein
MTILKAEVTASAAPYVLISSEIFVLPRKIEPVKEFFKDYDVRVLVYLRRHDTWWESAYNQAVKTVANPRWRKGVEAFSKFTKRKNSNHGNYRALVDRWAAVFGKENIIVRPYEHQQNQPHIVADLFTSMGLASIAQQLAVEPERENESLSFFALNLIDIYQRADIAPEIRSRLLNYVLTQSEKSPRYSAAPPKLRRQLVDENREDYEYIAKEYLDRKDGQLFYDPLPDPNEPWRAPKKPTIASIVEATVQAMSNQPKKNWWTFK